MMHMYFILQMNISEKGLGAQNLNVQPATLTGASECTDGEVMCVETQFEQSSALTLKMSLHHHSIKIHVHC